MTENRNKNIRTHVIQYICYSHFISDSFRCHAYKYSVPGSLRVFQKQVDILISKNQVLQILYIKHCVYKAT